MFNYNIEKLTLINSDLQKKIDSKTKPLGSLGLLEKVGLQIGCIQNTTNPKLNNPISFVFAGDHGAADEGISAFPKAVTQQMVLNFLSGGAAINCFSKQNGIELFVVDCGVDADFEEDKKLLNYKVSKSTKNYFVEKSMNREQLLDSFDNGRKIIETAEEKGSNIVLLGEMGIGNTSSASLIISHLCNISIEDCVGAGTGMVGDLLLKKKKLLRKAYDLHTESMSVEEVLETFSGFEISTMVGLILAAAEKRITVVVDGFITTAAALAAYKINSNCLEYMIFSHTSHESAHKSILEYLGVNALVNLEMRLGEGSGAAVAYPIIKSSVGFIECMASFEQANVEESDV